MHIAREGYREIFLATLILGAISIGALLIHWLLVVPFALIWVWAISFFRDPVREATFASGEYCSPADGTVTEISELEHYEPIGGAALRVGIFLSIFNVHINRAPCAGRVRCVTYRKGEFLDARHRESGHRNESNALLIDPDSPFHGPIEVRQVAGKVARRIICHAVEGDTLTRGERFGLIKFGSRTELIIPRFPGTVITVEVGDKVRAGLSVLARCADHSCLQQNAPKPETVGANHS